MRTVNMHEAKTHLSRLVDAAAKGEPFLIAKSGTPLVKVTPLETPTGKQMRRLGFLKKASFKIPKNFNSLGRREIEKMFDRSR